MQLNTLTSLSATIFLNPLRINMAVIHWGSVGSSGPGQREHILCLNVAFVPEPNKVLLWKFVHTLSQRMRSNKKEHDVKPHIDVQDKTGN